MKSITKKSTKNSKKTIVTMFNRSRLTRVGIPYYMNRFKYLAKNYNLIILTNQPGFFKDLPDAKIIFIPHHKNLPLFFRGVLFYIIRVIKLLSFRYDLLFLTASEGIFSFFNFRRRPVMYHIDVEGEPIGVKKNRLSNFFKKIFTVLTHFGFKKADKIFAPDSRLPNIAKELNINPNKIEHLQAGIDLKLFNPDNKKYNENTVIPRNRYVIMQTGTIHEKRGLNFLLECTKELSKEIENILLVLLGCETDHVEKINQIAKKMGIENNVLPVPMIAHELIPFYLKKADIGINILEVNKYYARQTSQKIFEYFAMGLPVISTSLPSQNIYIQNDTNGFTIKDKKEFKEAVMKLHNNKELYESMSLNAREFAKEYDLEKINKRLGEIIEELISG